MVEEIEDMKQKMEELETASLTTEKSLQVANMRLKLPHYKLVLASVSSEVTRRNLEVLKRTLKM